MLSSLPKLVDRAFILGMFLPTLLFATLLLFSFKDIPTASNLLDELTTKDLGKAVYFLLAVWAVAVVLLMLNNPLYRLLQGYSFPKRLAAYGRDRQRLRFKALVDESETLYAKWSKERESFPIKEEDHYLQLRLELFQWMPSNEADLLPTRFGNAIKAFEVYPRDVYGADGIKLWLRLIAVIPKPFGDQISDARSQLDFVVNCCLFSFLTAVSGILRLIYSGDWHALSLSRFAGLGSFLGSFQGVGLAWAAGGLIGSYIFYRWAVSLVPSWGELVRTAFDCYLPALATQLGFALPSTGRRRREFWTTFSQQAIYGLDPDGCSAFMIEKWNKAQPVHPKVDEAAKGSKGEKAESDEDADE